MSLLNKLTIKNLILNKKRTVVTIIGIMLSVALITAVATMYSSMIKSLINFEIYEKGDFHVVYYDVSKDEIPKIQNTREVEKVFLTKDIGYAELKESKNEYKPYILVKGFTKDSLEALSIKLVKGRLPENDSEIVIPSHLKTNGRVTINVGEEITLNVGTRVDYEQNELKQNNPYQKYDDENLKERIINTTSKTYKIVGIIERPASNIESYQAPGYTFITLADESDMTGVVNAYTKYTKSGSKEYTKVTSKILGVDENLFKASYDPDGFKSEEEAENAYNELKKAKFRYDINTYLIALENSPLKDSAVGSLGTVVIIVIIIILITSVFCIKNSFDISITEKIKQYGMLRSIGATPKQIKHNVFYEALILGIIGIPLGLVLGFLASYILVIICNIFLRDMTVNGLEILLSYSWIAFLISFVLGFITIYLSALRSAVKASAVLPIESIKNSANIKINSKKIKCPKIIKKIFKIGGEISYKNMKRNKKKYRTTTISIVVSVATVIALSYFMQSMFDVINQQITLSDYNIYITKYNSNSAFDEQAIETVKFDNIKDYSIVSKQAMNLKSPKYNEEYLKYAGLIEDKEWIQSDALIHVISIGDYQYRKYIKELNLNYDDMCDKAILYHKHKVYYINDQGSDDLITLDQFTYKKKDILELAQYNTHTSYQNLEIGYITEKLPFGEFSNNSGSILFVSDDVFEQFKVSNKYELSIYYDSSDPDKLQDEIESFITEEYSNFVNIDENVRIMKNLYTLLAIFLYGFVTVISLIGITNIFNTITTNMELRKPEFAMLKSIGMTKREFNNMVRFESLFIGLKSILFGVPIGCGLSYIIYLTMNMGNDWAFIPPILSIIISVIVVYLLITVLMKYSISKINKQNTIETIRNENI